eukprot:IDg16074t1
MMSVGTRRSHTSSKIVQSATNEQKKKLLEKRGSENKKEKLEVNRAKDTARSTGIDVRKPGRIILATTFVIKSDTDYVQILHLGETLICNTVLTAIGLDNEYVLATVVEGYPGLLDVNMLLDQGYAP